jgi:hypothetical protein
LAVHDLKMSVLGQKLSVAVYINQSLKPFLFLILKRSLKTPPPSAPKTLAMAAEESVVEKQRTNVDKFSDTRHTEPAEISRWHSNTIALLAP